MQLISVTSSRLNLSTPAHMPDLSFCWFSQRWVPHRHQRNNSHYVSTAHGSAQCSIWRRSKMTCTLPCNLRNHLTRKSSRAVIWLSHVVRLLQQRHLLSVDRQVRQQRCQLDVLGGLECVFSKKDNINRLLYTLHWMNTMFKSCSFCPL